MARILVIVALYVDLLAISVLIRRICRYETEAYHFVDVNNMVCVRMC